MFGNKGIVESSNQDGKKRSWKETIKTFLLITIILIGLGTIVATGGSNSGGGGSSSSSSGTVTGSGK